MISIELIIIFLFVFLFLLTVQVRRNGKELTNFYNYEIDKKEKHIEGWKRLNSIYSSLVEVSKINRDETKLHRVIAEKVVFNLEIYEASTTEENEKNLIPNDIKFLINIPGIGEKLALNLLNHYGNLNNFKNTSIEDLQKVDKIGPKLAQKIINSLKK